MSVSPKYIIILVIVILLAVVLKLSNPHKKYSSLVFWETATVETVRDVPEDALKKGNKNGSVLMWAASSASDPKIIKALVERGADVNEADPKFKGTPLTAAASYTKNPEIIRELIRLGANVNAKALQGHTALMIAAKDNTTSGIIEILVSSGANINDKNTFGQTALDLAKRHKNKTAEDALTPLMDDKNKH